MTPDQRMAAANEIMFGSGWLRVLPEGFIALIQALVINGPMTREEMDADLRQHDRAKDGLGTFAWDPLVPFTDESLAELDASFDEPAGSRRQSAAEVNAEEEAIRARRLAEQATFFEARNVPVDYTLGGALNLAISCGVLELTGGLIDLVAVPPLPSEMLPLTPEAIAEEDETRWNRIHEPVAQAIIEIFDPDGDALIEIETDLAQLSHRLDVDVETVRAALGVLISDGDGDGDFQSGHDISTVHDDQTFIVTVDWDEFARRRIGIRHARRDDY